MVRTVGLTVICACFSLFSIGQASKVSRPKLVVGLVVDQLRWDYLSRYDYKLGNGGIKRLQREGFNFNNAFINYTPSVTAAGHAAIYTGSVPAFHGIVGNEWVDEHSGIYINCVKDTMVKTIGSGSNRGLASPVHLLASTVGDELRLATNFRSRVFSVSFKDRSSILPGGRGANAAYWFDDSTGNWISSSYYMDALPQWVMDFNNENRPDKWMGKDWNLLGDSSAYLQSSSDDVYWEKTFPHEKKSTFPHTYKSASYANFGYSPWGNSYTVQFCISLLENEKLGNGQETDMLCLSLSSLDIVGHKMGPNSMENEDMILRLDADIESLLTALDKKIGKGNYLLFLTADHGASHVPAFLKEHKMAAGNLKLRGMGKELNDSCRKKFGMDPVPGVYAYQVYLDDAGIATAGQSKQEIEQYIIHLLLQKPEVLNVFSYAQFDKLVLPSTVKDMYANGYSPRRSGDIQILLKPQFTDNAKEGAEHATWYNYDTHIPLMWYGWNIPKGSSSRKVNITDIAPTVSSLLTIQMPNASIGQVLEEVKSAK